MGFNLINPLGIVPEGWQLVQLKEITTKIGSGATPRGGEAVYLEERESFAFIRSQNVFDYHFDSSEVRFINDDHAAELRGVHLEKGDILLNITGDGVTFGRSCMVSEEILPAAVNQHVSIIRLNQNLCLPGYLLAYLCNPKIKEYIASFNAGGSRRAITKGNIESFVIPLAPMKTQEAIQEIVLSISNKSELNREINQSLEQITQAIFKSWFVDFESVKAKIEAKATGRDPERAAMCAISGKSDAELDQLPRKQRQQLAATAALFPDELVESELGLIPKGWASKPFGNLLEYSIGGDWGHDEPDAQYTEKVKILRGTDLPRVFNGDDSSVPTRYVEPKKLEKRLLKDSDIIIEVSGGSQGQPTGRSLYITDGLIKRFKAMIEPASFCRLFRPIAPEIGLLLAVHLDKIYEDGKTWLYQNQSTGISNFQTAIFLERELVVVPEYCVTVAFFELIRPIYEKIYAEESQTLSELRDSLLPKLLAGDIAVDGEGKE